MTRLVDTLARALSALAFAATVALLGVVAWNVFWRAVFDASGTRVNLMFPGAIDAAQYLLLVAVFAALPWAERAGFIRVDILIHRLPRLLASGLERLWDLSVAAFGAACCWLFTLETLETFARGDATQDLQMPLWWFTGIAALGSAALALMGLSLALTGRPPATEGGLT
ncbi:TRAP transporter small permease [Paroceanicella profunda]|uniref:TRAP transporter small permease protein n=1 Tax=Paroceanicella profunda TaxID=2579971 RepID=A0A5B8FGR5_9RHOB|nr:TRAP transporter small permease [Paroceanicella profunda]QDL91188.1 TRAP transporter small permease [Paroceanicella profunda]